MYTIGLLARAIRGSFLCSDVARAVAFGWFGCWMKMFIIGLVLVTGFVVSALAQNAPSLNPDQTKFYDDFDDETSLIYDGGYAMIPCDVNCNAAAGKRYELINANNNVAATGTCDASNPDAILHLNIDQTTVLGNYRCRFEGQNQLSRNALNIAYRTCSNRNPDFRGRQCNDDNSFCFVKNVNNRMTTSTCVKNVDAHCNEPRPAITICPVTTSPRSLCDAVNNYASAYAKMNRNTCPTQDEVPKLKYTAGNEKRPRLYNEPIHMDNAANVRQFILDWSAANTDLNNANVTCVIKNRNGTMMDSKSSVGNRVFPFKDSIFNDGVQVFKLLCTFMLGSDEKASVSNYLVVHGQGGQADIEEVKDTSGTQLLKCNYTPALSHDFIVEYTWFKDGSSKPEGEGDELNVTNKPGTYDCVANPVYVSTSPYRRIPMAKPPKRTHVVSGMPGMPPEIPGVPEGSPNSTKLSDKEKMEGWKLGAIIAGALGVLVILLIIVISVVTVVCKSRKKPPATASAPVSVGPPSDAVTSPKPEPNPQEILLKDGYDRLHALANERGALNQVELDDWAKKRVSKAHDGKTVLDKEVTAWNAAAMAKENGMKEGVDFVKLGHERYANILTQVNTMVTTKLTEYDKDGNVKVLERPMPMNRMSDYNGNVLMICQAPKKEEFFWQWQTIFEEKVGTIVWVGKVTEQTEHDKISPYAPTDERESKKYKSDSGETEFTITSTTGAMRAKACSTVNLDVCRKQKVAKMVNGKRVTKLETQRRLITFLHFENWADFNIPENPKELAVALDHLADQQERQAKRRLPAVLIHCSAGMQRSVGVATCYIGRQMWLDRGFVHPMGILTYIRDHRMRALQPECFRTSMQLGVIAAILKAICSRAAFVAAGESKRAASGFSGIFDELRKKDPKNDLRVPRRSSAKPTKVKRWK